MTVAQFEAPGGSPETQALSCFEHLRDYLDGIGQRLDTASYLTVEVSRPDNLALVMQARRAVFGDHHPQTVSNRFTRLRAGALVRVTVHIDQPDNNTASEIGRAHV